MAITASPALGALIREKRHAQGLSLDALGMLVGVPRPNMIRHEQGKTFPRQALPAYVEVLGITRDELLAAGLTGYDLDELGVEFPDVELAVPVATPFFTREQIHPNWFRPIEPGD
jgi:transcriptional regulator with XRE-family HTH domain